MRPSPRDRARAAGARAGGMLFYSFFKTLVGKEVVVELKNDLAIRGTLHSVDQYLNIKLCAWAALDRPRAWDGIGG